MACYSCGEDAFIEVDGARTVCTQCGTVLEESAIVSEITFGETGAGAAVVQGSYVGADQTRVRSAGGYKTGGKQESREQTMLNGRRKMQDLAHALRLPDRLCDAGARYFNLAVNMNFIQGRRTQYVVAACLYSACRMDKTSHMLIDFSDLLEINVFVLGSTYLKLVKELSLQLPTVDPSLYISRFAALLEFGEETQKVAQDAVRLVARMGRDWMHIGRRPAGVCGACLLLAARMNNFRRTIPEIVQVVKIGDITLRKRLKEFRDTPSGALTVDDFRTLWLDETADPPAFSEAQQREKRQREARSNRTRKLEQIQNGELGVVDDEQDDAASIAGESEAGRNAFAELAAREEPLTREELYRDDDDDVSGSQAGGPANGMPDEDNLPLLPPLPNEEMPPPPVPSSVARGKRRAVDDDDENEDGDEGAGDDPDDERLEDPNLDHAIVEEMGEMLDSDKIREITSELDQRDSKRIAIAAAMTNLNTSDRLDDLDEDELDAFILTDNEVEAKSRLWMEINKDYLKKLADKQTGPDGELRPVTIRRPRKKQRPRDSENARGVSAADATQKLLSKKRFSKKINYAAIENLFGKDSRASSLAPSSIAGGSDDDDDDAASSVAGSRSGRRPGAANSDDEENTDVAGAESNHLIAGIYKASRGGTPVATRKGQPIQIPTSPWRARSSTPARARSVTPARSRLGSEIPTTPAAQGRNDDEAELYSRFHRAVSEQDDYEDEL